MDDGRIDRTDARIGPAGRDDEVTRGLRVLYAVPAEPRYWEALEARILARLAEEVDAWWTPFRHWVGPGLAAAAVAALAVGFALARSREIETRVAFQAIVETPRTPAQRIATQAGDDSARDATLQYVISP